MIFQYQCSFSSQCHELALARGRQRETSSSSWEPERSFLEAHRQGRSARHCPALLHYVLLQLNRIKLGKARARGGGIAVSSGCPGQAAGEGRHVSGGRQHERDLLRRGRPAEEIQPGEWIFFGQGGESYPECCCSPLQPPHQGPKGGGRGEKRARCRSSPTALPNGPMS